MEEQRYQHICSEFSCLELVLNFSCLELLYLYILSLFLIDQKCSLYCRLVNRSEPWHVRDTDSADSENSCMLCDEIFLAPASTDPVASVSQAL